MAGDEAAWERFVREYRPALYKAAAAIDPGGGRELADGLYGDLFGLRERDGVRQSLFRYFQGRSSLATWLRAVLAQRHVDRLRATRRLDPLPDETALPAASMDPETRGDRRRLVAIARGALSAAVARLDPRDRLRLSLYYARDMTLAAIGRMLREHEATVSRQLARARRAIREDVEAQLKTDHHLDEQTIDECFDAIVNDPGSLDVAELMETARSAHSIVQGSKGVV